MAQIIKKKSILPNTTPSVMPITDVPKITREQQPFVDPALSREFPNLPVPKIDTKNTGKGEDKPLNKNQIFRDDEGRAAGLTVGGKTYLGLKPNEVEQILQGEQNKLGGQLTQQFEQKAQAEKELQEQQMQGQILAPSVGLASPEMIESEPVTALSGVDFGAAIGAGLTQAGMGAAGGAALGLLGGPTAPITSSTLGIAGAIGGFLNGVRSNIAGQLSGEISAKGQTVSKVERNLRALVSDTNANPQNAAANLEMFNYQLSLLDSEYSNLKQETSRDLNKFLGKDGTTQLQRFELFNAQGGSRTFLTREMQMALLNPNPTKSLITMNDLMEAEE